MKMNKKGFTLIELLAVIVILAIIALIATPIILGIINDSRNSAKDRSAELVYNSIELAYQTKYTKKGTEPSLAELMTQLEENGISNATVDKAANKVTTSDKVVCTLSVDAASKLNVSCDGVSDDFKAPTLNPTMSATE